MDPLTSTSGVFFQWYFSIQHSPNRHQNRFLIVFEAVIVLIKQNNEKNTKFQCIKSQGMYNIQIQNAAKKKSESSPSKIGFRNLRQKYFRFQKLKTMPSRCKT